MIGEDILAKDECQRNDFQIEGKIFFLTTTTETSNMINAKQIISDHDDSFIPGNEHLN